LIITPWPLQSRYAISLGSASNSQLVAFRDLGITLYDDFA
jgi:hypothetical protein